MFLRVMAASEVPKVMLQLVKWTGITSELFRCRSVTSAAPELKQQR